MKRIAFAGIIGVAAGLGLLLWPGRGVRGDDEAGRPVIDDDPATEDVDESGIDDPTSLFALFARS